MLCYFSYLLTLTCSGYLLHNNFGDRNWVVLSFPRLFRSTLPCLFKYPSLMTALGLSNFSATKIICEKSGILSHLDFWVLHEDLWVKYAASMLGLAGMYYALSFYIEFCSIFRSLYCIVSMLRQIEASENRLVKQLTLPVTNNCQLMRFWCWAICWCAHSSNDCRCYRVQAKWHSFAMK